MKISLPEDQGFLDRAIKTVTGMLAAKREIWAFSSPTFENFDIHRDFGVSPIQWGLTMCALKLNRLKKRWTQHNTCRSDVPAFANDKDAEDSLIDLASYALLTLGILYRERAQAEAIQIEVDRYICGPEGKAEVQKLAQKMMGLDMAPMTDGAISADKLQRPLPVSGSTLPPPTPGTVNWGNA